MERQFLIILTVIFIDMIIISSYFFFAPPSKKESVTNQDFLNTTVPLITSFDESKAKIISQNPDLIFDDSGWEKWQSKLGITLTAPNMSHNNLALDPAWLEKDAGYFSGNLPDSSHKGAVVIPAGQTDKPEGAIWQNVTLPKGKIVLAITYANLDKYFDPCNACADSIVKVKIYDHTSNQINTILEDVINTNEGWKTVTLDISKYNGKTITMQAEGWAGGPCGICGDWLSVDKFYVATVS